MPWFCRSSHLKKQVCYSKFGDSGIDLDSVKENLEKTQEHFIILVCSSCQALSYVFEPNHGRFGSIRGSPLTETSLSPTSYHRYFANDTFFFFFFTSFSRCRFHPLPKNHQGHHHYVHPQQDCCSALHRSFAILFSGMCCFLQMINQFFYL